MAGNVSRESFGVFDNTGDISVDFPCHFVQEVCHLKERLVFGRQWLIGKYIPA